MRKRSGAGSLSIIEILISVMFFMLASAIALRVFVAAGQMGDKAEELSRAVLCAQNAAEAFKGAGGDLALTAGYIGGDIDNDGALLRCSYDKEWNNTREDALYTLTLSAEDSGGAVVYGNVIVSKIDAGRVYELRAAVNAGMEENG